MAIFEDGQADISLSDEALGLLDDASTERQEDVTPQEESATESPAIEQTSESEAQAPEEDDKEAGQQSEVQAEPAEVLRARQEVERLKTQYAEARAEMTRKQMEASQERKRRQELEEALAKAHSAAPQNREEFLQSFVNNPQEALQKAIKDEAGRLVNQNVTNLLQPVIEAGRVARRERTWEEACKDAAQNWPELWKDKEALVGKMAEIALEIGDRDLMFQQPKRIMKMAALELYGPPKVIDKEAIQAAAKAAKEDATRDLAQRNAGKAGLAAAQKTNQITDKPLTEEERIKKEIFELAGNGLFS